MARDERWWEEPLTVCPICKKEFAPAPDHYWKIGDGEESYTFDGNYRRSHLVCSYTCMRVWEKSMEEKTSKKRANMKPIEKSRLDTESRKARDQKIKQMADEGFSAKRIAIELGIGTRRVYQILNNF